jgi:hypothetical protein
MKALNVPKIDFVGKRIYAIIFFSNIGNQNICLEKKT